MKLTVRFAAVALVMSSLFLPPPSLAAKETAAHLVERALKVQADLGFEGLIRQDFAAAKRFSAEAVVEFDHARRYKVVGLQPERMRGVTLWVDLPRIGGYWPKDKLLVTGDARTAMVISPFVYQILNWKDLSANFEVRDMGVDIVALTPARKIGIYPKNRPVPYRHVWIDQVSGLVIKEERFLPGAAEPYFRSAFRRLRYPDKRGAAPVQALPAASFDMPEGARKLKIPGATGNKVSSFNSVAEAVAATKVKIREPGYVPPGFRVKSVWVAYLLGKPVTIITYLDGANILFVFDRPTIGGFIRVMGNWFSGGLIDKVFELRDYLPLYLYEREVKDRTYAVAGDLAPAELERIYQSLGIQ